MKTNNDFIEQNINLGLNFTFEDNLMQVYGTSNWTAESKQEYERFETLINDYKYEDELCIITAWCDVSGFDSWVLQQEESNYVSIDVIFKKEVNTILDLAKIKHNILEADDYFLTELTQYNYQS